jgi:small GTP-binding protein
MGKSRVVLIGAEHTGKTCIISKYVSGEFFDKHVTTLSPAFVQKPVEVGGRPIMLEIWDTAGEERFKSLSHLFYRDAEAGIVVFSIIEPESIARATEEIAVLSKERSDQVKVFLVGNKCDLAAERTVSAEDGRGLAQTVNAPYFETSAKTGVNIPELFMAVAESVAANKRTDEHPVRKRSVGDTVALATPTKKSSGCC